jgi:hypothetical protein
VIKAKLPNTAIPAYKIMGDFSLFPLGTIGCFLINRQMIIGNEKNKSPASPYPIAFKSKLNS